MITSVWRGSYLCTPHVGTQVSLCVKPANKGPSEGRVLGALGWQQAQLSRPVWGSTPAHG